MLPAKKGFRKIQMQFAILEGKARIRKPIGNLHLYLCAGVKKDSCGLTVADHEFDVGVIGTCRGTGH